MGPNSEPWVCARCTRSKRCSFERWAGTPWMECGEDYLACKDEIRQRLLSELFRHVPAAEQHVDYIEVSTPLSYETFAQREWGGFMGVESSPQRFEQDWLRPSTTIRGLFLTGQDVATHRVIGALVGATLRASVIPSAGSDGRDSRGDVSGLPSGRMECFRVEVNRR